ncbi:Pr6Pr family membrane protein [Microbacterium mangrovi]|uniref:Pr6Pr family membrane protein n=1 Tax=Microbacterium mangrovi TaxID=1348253 RepID=UPI000A6C70F9|nr:Pr6Pr family membrane protein [Microbacterium mangrovi]
MLIALRPVALAYRLVAVVLIATGILRVSNLLTPEPTPKAFLFYTVQSNVLCLVWMLLAVVVTIIDLSRHGFRGSSTPSARWAGAIMMAITVTMLIYLVVLVPVAFAQPGAYEPFTLTDNLVHIVTPCLVIADWLLFTPKGRMRWYDPLLWALIPYAYLVWAFAAGAAGVEFVAGTTYPYPFMDVATLGVGGVAVQIALLTVALLAVGFVYVAVDRLLGRAAMRRVSARSGVSAGAVDAEA